MPTSPPSPCSRCGQPAVRKGKCAKHDSQADRLRGSSSDRGYGKGHVVGFRANVLADAHYLCSWPAGCDARATVADHFPRTRKQLLADGCDPDDPQYGRALCKRHHDSHTAATSIARLQR